MNPAPLYRKTCERAWTGDQFGREWNLGFAVYANDITDDDQGAFVIFEDDGRGNGNYVADADSLELAKLLVDRRVAEADERGF